MTKFHVAIAAAMTVALSGVAHADTLGETAKYDMKTKTYCVSHMVTGSIIPQRDCETRQGWINRGATVTASPNKQIASK